MSKTLVCVGGQEDGRKVTILHGRAARFPKRREIKTTDPWPEVDVETTEFVDYDLRLINFKDGAPVEFLALKELSTSRAIRELLDAYAKRVQS